MRTAPLRGWRRTRAAWCAPAHALPSVSGGRAPRDASLSLSQAAGDCAALTFQTTIILTRARAQTVDFTKLDMATLKRYKRHYRLKTRQNVTKTELALAVAKHFASQHVDEAETIQLFVYSARSSTLQYGAPLPRAPSTAHDPACRSPRLSRHLQTSQ